jgi:F-type H+-transporting ATPase subunit delta
VSVATPYAAALYEAATEAKALREVDGDLATIADAIAGDRTLARALVNPAVPADAKGRILADLAKGANPLVGRFLAVVLQHRRLGALAEIQRAFADLVRLEQNELAVELTTAVPIDDKTATKVQKQLATATGLTVTMARTVDPAILGGVVLRVRDRLIDASLRRRLDLLGRSLRAARIPSA